MKIIKDIKKYAGSNFNIENTGFFCYNSRKKEVIRYDKSMDKYVKEDSVNVFNK